MLEEDVHQLPQHVVERLDQLLADERVAARRLELPLGARRGEAIVRQPRRAARQRLRVLVSASNAITMSSGSASSSTCDRDRRRGRPIAGSARLPTITGWTNSTATWRTSERAAGECAQRDQPPAAREALRHPVAELRDPLGLALEEARVGRVAALEQVARQRSELDGLASRRRRGRRGGPHQPFAPSARPPRPSGRSPASAPRPD